VRSGALDVSVTSSLIRVEMNDRRGVQVLYILVGLRSQVVVRALRQAASLRGQESVWNPVSPLPISDRIRTPSTSFKVSAPE
jgi:hypothetical protein